MKKKAKKSSNAAAILILCTAPDKATAERIARALLEKRLCACVNIVSNVHSLFHWQGKIDSAQEQMMFIKTRQSLYAAVEKTIKSLHPYDVPEIVSLALMQLQPAYRAWLFAETSK